MSFNASHTAESNEFLFSASDCQEKVIISNRNYLLKRLMDLTLTILALPIILLCSAIISLLIIIDSKGPIFFIQKRVGQNGKYFDLYKFRTMVPNAEELKSELSHLNEMDGPIFKIKDDPRITNIGRFLRKFSLDELPQFINVLNGSLSLVGPRPPTVDEYLAFNDEQKIKLKVPQGLTGMWQINSRGTLGNFEVVLQEDLKYLQNTSFLLDLKIIFKTILVVIKGNGC